MNIKNNINTTGATIWFVFLAFLPIFLPAQQNCNLPVPPGLTCDTAPVLCQLDGYCSTTVNSNVQPAPGPFCGQIENAHWIKFAAGSTEISLQISPSDCGNGLQGHIYQTPDCNQFTAVSNCYDISGVADFVLTATNLTIGEIYTLLIDGKGGDVCEYELTLLDGETTTPAYALAGNDDFICPGEVKLLNGINNLPDPNIIFEWSSTDGNLLNGIHSLQPTIGAGGTYYLTSTDTLLDCSFTDSVVIELAMPPVIDFETPEKISCLTNQEVVVDATNSIVFPTVEIQWSDPDGNSLPQDELSLTVDAPGSYTLLLLDTQTGCSDSQIIVVEADLDTPVAEAGISGELNCLLEEIQLDGTQSSAGPQFEIIWSTDAGQFVEGENTLTPIVNKPGIYSLLIRNTENGCEDTDEVTITENAAFPQGVVLSTTNPCFGQTDGAVTIESVINGNAPFSYALEPPEFRSDPTFLNVQPGAYQLTVQDAIGCEWDSLIVITELPEFVLDLGDDQDFFLGEHFDISVQTNQLESNLAEIIWTPSTGLDCTGCLEPSVQPFESMEYQLQLVDQNGCTASDVLRFNLKERPHVFLPNAFSPNSDGMNDSFYVQADEAVVEILNFKVFNRWGALVFDRNGFRPNDPGLGWQGTFKGKPLETGIFTFFAKVALVGGKEEVYSGDVMLTR